MIGIVYVGNIEYCPYLEKYKRVLVENGLDYEVLFWDREGLEKEYPNNYYFYNKKSDIGKKKIYKLTDFLKYRKWLTYFIKMRKYEKLIILDTLSGIMLSNVLLNNFKGKYILDIRDYSYEKIKIFYNIEVKIINSSYLTCISSEGFRNFLLKNYHYTIAHNFDYNDILRGIPEFNRKKQYGDALNLVWIGLVRYYNHQVRLINKLANNTKFNLIFHGIGPDLNRLIEYSQKNGVQNIKFTGRYSYETKAGLLLNADILNNSYDVKVGNEVKYAISNKFYDGIVFKVPQLTEVGTYKEHKVRSAGIGIGLDVSREDFADRLYDYYFSIDKDQYNKNCKNELRNILKDDELYLNRIQKFLIG